MNLHPKVTAATVGSGLAGAITVILVWLLSLNGVTVPDQVSAALTIVIGALGALVAGYLTPNPTSAAAPATPQQGASK